MGALAFTIVPRSVLGGRGHVAPSDRIQLGYIGLGKQSHHLVNAINGPKETAVLAACDVDAKKLDYFTGLAQKANEKKFQNIVMIVYCKRISSPPIPISNYFWILGWAKKKPESW